MATDIVVCLVLVSFGALGATILVYQSTQRARGHLAREQVRVRQQIAAVQARAREEHDHLLSQIAAEQGRARGERDRLLAQIEHVRAGLTELQTEARAFKDRYLKYDHLMIKLCNEIDRTLLVFVSVYQRTPGASIELIQQVNLLKDRFSILGNGLLDARRLIDAGVVGSQMIKWMESGWSGSGWDGPQGNLSAQWQD